MAQLRTHEVCPEKVATQPEPGFPEDEVRTSCRPKCLSSDALNNNFVEGKYRNQFYSWMVRGKMYKEESGRTLQSYDQERDLTDIECVEYVAVRLFVSASKMYICPTSLESAIRDPSGL
jgi:hypothetical protein